MKLHGSWFYGPAAWNKQLVPVSFCPGSAMPLSPAAWLAREAERSGAPRGILNKFWTFWSTGVLGIKRGDGGSSIFKAITVGWNKLVWGQLGWVSNRHSSVPWMVWYDVFYSHLSISLINKLEGYSSVSYYTHCCAKIPTTAT